MPYRALIEALRASPEQVAELVISLPAAAHTWQPQPNEWNLAQTVAHLAAAEAPFEARLRRILAEDNPFLPYFGPEVAKPEVDAPLENLVARFRASRDQLLNFLDELDLDAWQKLAVHETMGPTTFALQVQNIINHDAEHLNSMKAIITAYALVAENGV
jgi:uncharacterized damage-inducible protein DinB